MNEGEVEVQGEEKYCEKRCFCCTCWTVLLVVLCCLAVMSVQFYMLNGTLPGMDMLPASMLESIGHEDAGAGSSASAGSGSASSGPAAWENSNGYKWNIGAAADSDV